MIQQLILKTVGAAFFIIWIMGAMSSCSSPKNLVKTKYYSSDSTIVIDGDLKEWERPLKEPDNYTNIQYNVGNDAENLYICVRIPDKGIQRRIMGLGLTVYIDTLAKKRDKVGVGYPLALTQQQLETVAFQAQKGGIKIDDRELDKAYAAICQEFELIGFIEEDLNERLRVSNLASKDLKTAMGFDPLGAMICEYKIPWNQLFKGKMSYDEVISVGIRVNPVPETADNDPGLFNDPNSNPITGSNQLNNPLGGAMLGQQQQPGMVNRQPSRSTSNNITGIWMKIALTKPQ